MPRKISVIMASYLGEYKNSASNRVGKFTRAVKSFLDQKYPHKELIIVSDGCEITNNLYEKYLAKNPIIKLVKIEKQPLFSGSVRQAGIDVCTGEIICYLDTDDFIRPNHLNNIAYSMDNNDVDWIFYDEEVFLPNNKLGVKLVMLKNGSIGTSSIAHKKETNLSWEGCDGYGHDYQFIMRLKELKPKFMKQDFKTYVICHIPNLTDM